MRGARALRAFERRFYLASAGQQSSRLRATLSSVLALVLLVVFFAAFSSSPGNLSAGVAKAKTIGNSPGNITPLPYQGGDGSGSGVPGGGPIPPTKAKGDGAGIGSPAPKWDTPTAVPPHSPPGQVFTGWERPALAELAAVLGWPTAVSYDNSGRLQVVDPVSTTTWSLANIRAFDYGPGAEAAFNAEQQDAACRVFS